MLTKNKKKEIKYNLLSLKELDNNIDKLILKLNESVKFDRWYHDL